ncbi:MAG TPA: amino acid permease [Thermoanaerobaculia bacterium]|nr:amino acid permease [Thermoanaerobaculia bacterium]
MSPADPSGETELARGLNLWDTSLLVLGLVIGGGIFLTPTSIAKALPSGPWILGAWIVGGLLAVAGGLVFAELGAMLPHAGGVYVYIRDAFGDLPAFLYAWVAFWIIIIGSDAAVAVGFSTYLAVFFPALGNDHVVATLGPVAISAGQLVAVALTLVLSATHYVGVREGARIQGLFTVVIVVVLAGIAIGGVFAPSPAAAAAPASSVPPIALVGFGTALIGVFWTFYGWNEIAAVAGEVSNPRRNLPLALILGTGLVTFLYVGVNAAFLKAIPAAEMAVVAQPGAVAATRLFGAGAALLVSLAITAAAVGCVSAGLVPAPRVVYALAKDGLFPKPFARVHPRFRTPSFAIVVQAIWMSLLCLSGRYDQLYTYATFFVIVAYAAAGIALFVFRRRRPDLPRPYRCWGYPVVPFVFVASSIVLAVNTVKEQPKETLAGIGILLLGLPFYFALKRRRPPAADASTSAGTRAPATSDTIA